MVYSMSGCAAWPRRSLLSSARRSWFGHIPPRAKHILDVGVGRWKLGRGGFRPWRIQRWHWFFYPRKGWFANRFRKCPKMKILSELGENWNLGVFGYGDFKNDISFGIRAKGGLQTGLENIKNGNFVRLRWKLRLGGFRVWGVQKWYRFWNPLNVRFVNRFKKFRNGNIVRIRWKLGVICNRPWGIQIL